MQEDFLEKYVLKTGKLVRNKTKKNAELTKLLEIYQRERGALGKKIAALANSKLAVSEQIHVHPHILRHTMLRTVREERGIEFAIEYAGHVSEKYIRRYTMPSANEQEDTLEELFG